MTKPKPPPAPIPQTRLRRLAGLGMAAGGLAAGAAAQGLRRLARGEAPDFRGALLSAPNAKRLAERLARMRGAAMKIGQMVSMQGEDLLPPEFAQALSMLRSQAAPMPAEQLRRPLRSPPPETIFLHRKLAGSFLLLARLEARVDARALILPFLPKAP
ncbi:MAG TPA: hypothetical protein VN324_14975 [Quisquiliibacterium sp.]|nr:hypothetical protein [Quisquiliibacterium sp.]